MDLSERGGRRRLAAWIGGVRRTPTLLVVDGHHWKYEGIRAISDYVDGQRKIVTAGKEVNVE